MAWRPEINRMRVRFAIAMGLGVGGGVGLIIFGLATMNLALRVAGPILVLTGGVFSFVQCFCPYCHRWMGQDWIPFTEYCPRCGQKLKEGDDNAQPH